MLVATLPPGRACCPGKICPMGVRLGVLGAGVPHDGLKLAKYCSCCKTCKACLKTGRSSCKTGKTYQNKDLLKKFILLNSFTVLLDYQPVLEQVLPALPCRIHMARIMFL